jgi:hypothetical protein
MGKLFLWVAIMVHGVIFKENLPSEARKKQGANITNTFI